MTAPWEYRDPLEGKLAAEISAHTLTDHVRAMAAWERESGSPGEARAFDYIERTLKAYGIEVDRREIEAYISLPLVMRLSRVLVPLTYTSGDRFDHDLALPMPPLAGLQRARELAALDPNTDAYKFTRVALQRELNRVVHALDSALSVTDEL